MEVRNQKHRDKQ